MAETKNDCIILYGKSHRTCPFGKPERK